MSSRSEPPSGRRELSLKITWLCITLAALMAAFPFIRTGYRCEVDYNEGWNVYNAALVASHQWLYPVRYGWTSVNYPMLWFVILAQLHKLTNDYLFTARALSLIGLLGCCGFVARIVRRLGASTQAAWLAASFCLALFVTEADQYVGMADPQISAQMLFLAGLSLYLINREDDRVLCLSALVFVIAGSIKHNPIDVPLAVLLDLLLVAPRKAVWFSAWGIIFAFISGALNVHFGGPFFVAQLLAPREYSGLKAVTQGAIVLGPILLPLGLALYAAWRLRDHPKQRIAAILLATSLCLGLYFNGGSGVSTNAFFSAFIAIAILTGLFFDDRIRASRLPDRAERLDRFTINPSFMPLIVFGWLVIPWLLVPKLTHMDWNPVRRLAEAKVAEKRFELAAAMLKHTDGPALCESLLLCAYANKPYVYDPFNATRLIHMHKLDPAPMVERIERHEFAAVQLDQPVEEQMHSERFDQSIAEAIRKSYRLRYSAGGYSLYTPAR